MLPLSLIKNSLIYIYAQDGVNDVSFMRNCYILVQAEMLSDNSLSNIFRNIITEIVEHKKTIEQATASILAIEFDAYDIIESLKLESLDNSQLQLTRSTISESVSTVMITKNVKTIQDITTKIINKELSTATEIKSQFQTIMSELFDVMIKLDSSSVDEEIEVSSDNIENVLVYMKKYLKQSKIIIPTGLTYLDEYLQGGLHNSRLYTLVMKSGDGKSLTMLSLAQKIQELVKQGSDTYAMLDSKMKDLDVPNLKPTVYYFTFENSTEETLERYLPNLAGGSVNNIVDFESRIDTIKENIKRYDIPLKIRYRGGFSTSPVDLIQILEREKVKGYYPAAIFVDYLGIMISGDGQNERRLQLEKITAGLKNLAVMYNVPVMTGVQVKKDSFDKSELKESDIKESSGIIDNSDIILGAWQGETLHETYIKEMNFKILKQRNFVKNVQFKVGVDFTKFQLFNLTDEQQSMGQNRMPNTYDPTNSATMYNQTSDNNLKLGSIL